MIRRDTEKLSLPGGRRVSQPGHEIALQYLKKRMKEIGLIPFKNNNFCLPYRDKFTNLAGVIPGRNSSALPVLIGAHYDSAIDAPCADDNAISVAMILSISEILMKKPPERNTIVAFFDAEEKPCFLTENMGSTRFCNDHCNDIDFACVVILDMIGHDFQVGIPPVDFFIPGIRQMLFILGSESHLELPAIVEHASSEAKGLRVIPTLTRYIGDRSDYHAFRKAGQPYLFISKGWGKHSHKPEDTVDWINFNRVELIQNLLLEMLELLDKAPMAENRAPEDPFLCEIRMMRKAIGWPLPLILAYLGFYRFALRSRKDIDFLMGKILKLTKF
ncbi:MAG: M28 family peptidase [Candidatus Sabulitectum sp.]|nr:M28 family peptidase [Candidatus Sabulitectum sp.]